MDISWHKNVFNLVSFTDIELKFGVLVEESSLTDVTNYQILQQICQKL